MYPRWFRVCLAGAAALVVFTALYLAPTSPPADTWRPVPPVEVKLAFWAIIGLVAGWIWKGLEVAGRVALQALAWSVQALWAFATATFNGLKAIGQALALAGRQTWQFLRTTLARAVVTGWQKFWSLVGRFRAYLERSFKPVLEFLMKLRKRLMAFYTDWIRPVLDVIDIGRKFARVLAAFGIEWARALDRRLAELQEQIDRPFRAVLSKVNEIIGLVNRVVTADGLFQRLALIRSIERDLRHVSRAIANWRSKPLTEEDYRRVREAASVRTIEQVRAGIDEQLRYGTGPHAAIIDEMVQQWTIYLRARG